MYKYDEIPVEKKKLCKAVVAGGIAVLALITFLILNPIVIIRAGQRGIVLEWGAVTGRILNEGIHWVLPVKNKIERIDVTTRKVDVKGASASSKDLQTVHTTITINYRLDPLAVNKIYQTLRHDYELRVIYPAVNEHLKASTAKFTAEELITKREKIKDDFHHHLTDALKKNFIFIENVFITDFGFSKEFSHAIEAKVTAEQQALQAKNVLEQRKYEAEQVVVTAKAEAEKIRIQAQAITQQGGKDYVQLKAIEKWDGKLPQQMIPNATLPFLNLGRVKE